MLKVQYQVVDPVDVFFPIQTSGIQLNFAKDANHFAQNVGVFKEARFMKTQNFATLLTRHSGTQLAIVPAWDSIAKHALGATVLLQNWIIACVLALGK